MIKRGIYGDDSEPGAGYLLVTSDGYVANGGYVVEAGPAPGTIDDRGHVLRRLGDWPVNDRRHYNEVLQDFEDRQR